MAFLKRSEGPSPSLGGRPWCIVTSSPRHRASPSQSSHTERNLRGSAWTQGCQGRKRTHLTTFPVWTFIQTRNIHWEFITDKVLWRSWSRNPEVNQTVPWLKLKPASISGPQSWLRFPGFCPATWFPSESPTHWNGGAINKCFPFPLSWFTFWWSQRPDRPKEYSQQTVFFFLNFLSKIGPCLDS